MEYSPSPRLESLQNARPRSKFPENFARLDLKFVRPGKKVLRTRFNFVISTLTTVFDFQNHVH